MNNTALCLACLLIFLLCTATAGPAAESKTVFNTGKIEYEAGTGAERCRDKCWKKSGPDVQSLLSEGWKVVSSSPKEVIGEHYSFVPCNTCKPHGCVCIGTEYLLQRDEPAPRIDAKGNAGDKRDNDGRLAVLPPESDSSKHELDLLKKEIELLKRENASLKHEIEILRNRLGSKQGD